MNAARCEKCQRRATVRVNGKNFCGFHKEPQGEKVNTTEKCQFGSCGKLANYKYDGEFFCTNHAKNYDIAAEKRWKQYRQESNARFQESLSVLEIFRQQRGESQVDVIQQSIQSEEQRRDNLPPSSLSNLEEITQIVSIKNVKNDCSICQDHFVKDQKARMLPCNHIFHIGCIDEWLKRDLSCPMCRERL